MKNVSEAAQKERRARVPQRAPADRGDAPRPERPGPSHPWVEMPGVGTMTRVTVSALPHGTPLGRRAGLVGLGFLFAGFNTGNNLFYLVFTVLAASELTGFCLAWWAIGRLIGKVVTPHRGRAGSPVRVTIHLTNRGKWLPVPALVWRLRTADGAETEVRTPFLPPGATVTGTGRLPPSRRGWLEVGSVEARTDFPLGLARMVVKLGGPRTKTLVTPQLGLGDRGATGVRRGDVRRLARPKATGEEPVEAREYRPGDDARRIDWKASARTEHLLLRERRGDPPRAIQIRLDRSGIEGRGFETKVSRAAGAACRALARGEAVGFASDEIEMLPRSGPSQHRRILEYLALVRPGGAERQNEMGVPASRTA